MLIDSPTHDAGNPLVTEAAAAIEARFGEWVTRLSFYTPYPVDPNDVRATLAALRPRTQPEPAPEPQLSCGLQPPGSAGRNR